MKHEILLGLTTTPASDWRGKVEEMKKFGIKRIALFPTFLKIDERRELYELLEEIKGLEIPHVHLRCRDMENWEMEWYKSKGAEVFNIHCDECDYEVVKNNAKNVFIENSSRRLILNENMPKCAGICLDIQHWETSKKRFPKAAKETERFVGNYPIGCCHMSALPNKKPWNMIRRILKRVGGHYMMSLDEMDYIKKYAKYFPKYMSIELENSFKEQLVVKKYLEEKLGI